MNYKITLNNSDQNKLTLDFFAILGHNSKSIRKADGFGMLLRNLQY